MTARRTRDHLGRIKQALKYDIYCEKSILEKFLQQARTTSMPGISTRELESMGPGIYIVISTTLSERFESSTLNITEEPHRDLHTPRPLLLLTPASRRSLIKASNPSCQTSPLSYGSWTHLVQYVVFARHFSGGCERGSKTHRSLIKSTTEVAKVIITHEG
jgi:hypothetical protein